MKAVLRALLIMTPWPLRRRLLERLFGYELDPTSWIGVAWVFPGKLIMGPHSQIGHLTTCVHLDEVRLEAHATLGRGNWITGFPSGTDSPHFACIGDRRSVLLVEEHAAITNRHLIDCTSPVSVGRFSTFAGFASQILTHSIDLEKSRQASRPVTIGEYCFVGTNCVLLGGASLPDRSVLGAKSLLNRAYQEGCMLYGGVPAKAIKALPVDYGYFHRKTGSVV